MITSKEVQLLLPIKEVLVESSNYIQFIDTNDNFSECQIDYTEKRWYLFKTTGKADSPMETFIKWVS